jgi:hypothetical protein
MIIAGDQLESLELLDGELELESQLCEVVPPPL